MARVRLAKALAFIALTLVTLTLAGNVVKPGRSVFAGDGGAAWEDFSAEPDRTLDVVMFGNSHLFDSVDPIEMWRAEGIASFTHGGPAQMLKVTRWWVRETFRTQHPRVVVIEMSSASYADRNYDPEHQIVNVGYMPMSDNRIAAGLLATPRPERTSSLFDVWQYHSRWTELARADFLLTTKGRDDWFMKGYLPKFESRPVSDTPVVRPASDPFADGLVAYNIEALEDIVSRCERQGTQVLLLVTPTGPPNIYTYYLNLAAEQLAEDHGNVRSLDLSEPGAVPGLSYDRDFFDGGHVNHGGAVKVSRTLARYLAQTYELPDRRTEPDYRAWDEARRLHDSCIASETAGVAP